MCFVSDFLLNPNPIKIHPSLHTSRTEATKTQQSRSCTHAYTHLDKAGYFVRILFIEFSSAFNTIQPCLMAQKLLSCNVTPRLILWIMQFLEPSQTDFRKPSPYQSPPQLVSLREQFYPLSCLHFIPTIKEALTQLSLNTQMTWL